MPTRVLLLAAKVAMIAVTVLFTKAVIAQSATEYVIGSDGAAPGCEPCAAANTMSWNAGVELTFLQPRFSDNPAFSVMQADGSSFESFRDSQEVNAALPRQACRQNPEKHAMDWNHHRGTGGTEPNAVARRNRRYRTLFRNPSSR
jgi:hypothetical protein